MIYGWLALLPPGLDWADYGFMCSIVMAGACLQGIGGIGFAMFSAPIAGLMFPTMVPGPLIALGAAVSLMSALREYRWIAWRVSLHAISGRFVGGAVATLFLVSLPAQQLAVAFALMLLAAIGLSVAGWRFAPSGWNSTWAGLASGVMGTITSAGAPPLALLTQDMPPQRIRATVGCILVVGGVTSLLMLSAVGRFGRPQIVLSLLLFPWVVVGFVLSAHIGPLISANVIRRLLLGMMTLSAMAILGRAAL